MALDLQILRTAKAALDEGLLNSADYDSMKASFIKAQSIKAGVEAGFISETDYAEARAAFFSGLGMPVGGAVAASAPSQLPPSAPTSQGSGIVRNATKDTPIQAQPPSSAPPSAVTAAPPGALRQHSTSLPSEATAVQASGDKDVPPLSLPDAQPQPEDCNTPTTGGSASLLPTPTGLSDRGGKSAAADKVRLFPCGCSHKSALQSEIMFLAGPCPWLLKIWRVLSSVCTDPD